jgi:hypothetical protein
VRGAGSGHMFGARVTELECVNAGEEVFPGTEEDGRDGHVHHINEPRGPGGLRALNHGLEFTSVISTGSPGFFIGILKLVVRQLAHCPIAPGSGHC